MGVCRTSRGWKVQTVETSGGLCRRKKSVSTDMLHGYNIGLAGVRTNGILGL